MANTVGIVLMVASSDNPTVDAVVSELEKRAARVARVDTGDFPARMRLSASIRGKDGWGGRLWLDGLSVGLAEVRSVYYWRPTAFSLPSGLSDGDAVFATVEARLGLGGVLGALDARVWVGHPARTAVAEYKPIQLATATRVGLEVPCTLITNDHAAVVEFADQLGGPLVCKTLSSLILADDGEPHFTYTTRIDPADIDPAQVAATTHLFQAWVPKDHEVRVTMVGHRPYGVAIRSASERGHVDWRADYDALTYTPVAPPAEVTAGMIRFLDTFDLSYGVFDFVVTPDGRWVMLECNPAGQWLWLQEATGLPIGAGIAELLTEGALR